MMVNGFKYNGPNVNKIKIIGEETEGDIKDMKNDVSQPQSRDTHCGSSPNRGYQSIDNYNAHKKNR